MKEWANGLKIYDSEKNWTMGLVGPTLGQCTCILPLYSKIFTKMAWPVKVNFYGKHLYEEGTNVFINKPGHMTKMATISIYSKNLSKVFSGTAAPIATKLDVVIKTRSTIMFV